MKFSILASSVFAVLAVSTSAFATAVSTRVVLHNVKQDGVVLAQHVVVVTPNLRTQKLNVEILKDVCGQLSTSSGPRCMAAAMPVREFELPYTFSEPCGSKIYEVRKDDRPRDGALVEIMYADHGNRLCTDLVANLKEFSLRIETLRGFETEYTATNQEEVAPASDHGAIYEALNVPAVNLNPGIAGSSRLQKSVGGLVCEKSLVIVPGAVPQYSCVLN